ncbi:ADP-ribosylglycohydrolase family protein [Acetobacterium paludosum]|uniref:ADP-ribosylglycohydrolase family protein n=1 Tax=Acetobacterium paludosum TaxID=52693 RepID=A0A923KSP0_9FIRM|nr:ADP-ribosylglycohydrolase family protein [Acetobacterium paludosum]MBC3888577.1 ADP-ribosylglycohydrolase family protein [Acetobacterium paludosum]
MKRDQNSFRGCLVGGAIGDALGAPVEFMQLDEIISQYGPDGIQDLVISSSEKALITDDTQMTLFTAEGILRSETRRVTKGICHPPSVVFHAYQRWLLTQGYPRVPEYEWVYDGWLLDIEALHACRAPGVSCLTALRSEDHGTMDDPINTSRGCGGAMRSAPVGLFYRREEAFQLAAEMAALTHGHPSGFLSAGALAYLIDALIEGFDLETAVTKTLMILKKYEGHEKCTKKLELAEKLSKMGSFDDEAIALLGGGWVGEEALAIAVYCALKYQHDFRKALQTAVNHSGDSDSIGAITGNILGVYLGLNGIPVEWIEKVELKDVLIQIADDLLIDYDESNIDRKRYPGY